jgi:flavodoxin
MDSAIVYYSYSGNTKMVSQVLADYLKEKSKTEIVELKSLDESNKFLIQAARAFRHKRARIAEPNFNLSDYDLICFGTPVWAFGPVPAMNTYLDKCFGIEGKEIILFTTYGSGAGNERCLNYMRDILAKKGAKQFRIFSIQQFKVNDREHVLSKIKEMTRL